MTEALFPRMKWGSHNQIKSSKKHLKPLFIQYKWPYQEYFFQFWLVSPYHNITTWTIISSHNSEFSDNLNMNTNHYHYFDVFFYVKKSLVFPEKCWHSWDSVCIIMVRGRILCFVWLPYTSFDAWWDVNVPNNFSLLTFSDWTVVPHFSARGNFSSGFASEIWW